ncbi:MAG: sugar ABC transporter ATP-binding protein [Ruminococcaceae bacterium]|nr:sugar ABC transporter ATP-binding protein [Oscillospiraceae bacterium]
MSNPKLLVMQGIHKRFPGVYALKDVHLELESGEVHAILGENGAGKSTLIKVLGGIYSIDQGEIYIDGERVFINNVHDAQANGISMIHQELVLVPYMTVAENIFLGREPLKGGFVDYGKMEQEAQELLDAYEMHINACVQVRSLTIAQQQMVEIVKAISFHSKILVMDEPTSSLSDKEVAFLFDTIRTLKSSGVGIIYISHKMSELQQICDRVTVMRDGEYIGTRIVRETSNAELIAMMVGRELTSYYTRTYQEPGETVLEVKNLSDGGMVKDASFAVRKGEIVGFAGLVGAGRSEAMKCVFGLSPLTHGEILVDGKPAQIRHPDDAMRHGIALVPENRKEEALFAVQSVQYNLTIKVLESFIKGIFVNQALESEIAGRYIRMMSIKTPSFQQLTGNLSGGNQQKVVIGRWLATNPQILILDEPTRGVDVGAKSEIYIIMNELVKNGVSIVMISSELPEIINMSDRVYVMCEGRVTGCLERGQMTQEQIMRLATADSNSVKI